MSEEKAICLVTGGAGFIGSHMVDLLLKEGYMVRVLDNKIEEKKNNLKRAENHDGLDLYEASIMDFNEDYFKDVKYVFHFAGIGDIVPSIETPKEYLETNVLGTINVLEASRKNSISKFVYAASSTCYGLASTPTKETHDIEPQYPYALSKYQGEMATLHWSKVYGLNVNSMRIFNAYGTRSRTTGAYGAVMGTFLKQKICNKPLTVVGDGTQKRDFIYVTDVAKAFLCAAKQGINGEVYNVGAGNPRSILELTKLIGGEIVYIPKRPGEPEITCADISKSESQLGWYPKISLEQGVLNVLENIDYWEDAPLWTPESIELATKSWFTHLKK